MPNGDYTNQWDEGGDYHAGWGRNQWGGQPPPQPSGAAGLADTPKIESVTLTKPPPMAQETNSTCWAYALAAWCEAQVVGGVAKFGGELVMKYWERKDSKGVPFLHDDASLRVDVWHIVASENGANRTDFKVGREITPEYVYQKLKAGKYLLVGEVAEGTWKHAYVIYGIIAENDPPWWLAMNPDGGKYVGAPIPYSPGRWPDVLAGPNSRFMISTKE